MSGNGREDIQLKMERSFLAGVLLSEDAEHMSENLTGAAADLFVNNDNRKIYSGMLQTILQGTKPDVVVLSGLGIPIAKLCELSGYDAKPYNAGEYLRSLKMYKARRDVRSILESGITETAAGDPYNVREKTVRELERIDDNGKIEHADVSQLLLNHLNRLKSTDKNEIGFPFGIPKLDDMAHGIRRGKMYILGARAKSGKTRFIVHSIKQVLRAGGKAAFFTLEMRTEEITELLLSSFSGINGDRFCNRSSGGNRTPYEDLNNVEIRQYEKALSEVNSYYELKRLFLYRPRKIGAEQVLRSVKYFSKFTDVIFIDYLTNIDFNEDTTKENFSRILERFCSRIAAVCKESGVSVMLAVQLNQSAERQKSTFGDIKHSGGIIEAADTALILDYPFSRNPTSEDTQTPARAATFNKNKAAKSYPADYFEFAVKQRYGRIGTIAFRGDLGTCTFYGENRESETIESPF